MALSVFPAWKTWTAALRRITASPSTTWPSSSPSSSQKPRKRRSWNRQRRRRQRRRFTTKTAAGRPGRRRWATTAWPATRTADPTATTTAARSTTESNSPRTLEIRVGCFASEWIFYFIQNFIRRRCCRRRRRQRRHSCRSRCRQPNWLWSHSVKMKCATVLGSMPISNSPKINSTIAMIRLTSFFTCTVSISWNLIKSN